MPELPEVETIKNDLQDKLIGSRILDVEVLLPKLIDCPTPKEFQRRVRDTWMTSLERRGKFLVFTLDRSERMAIHLRMSGRLLLVPRDVPREKHTHILFFIDGDRELRFVNPRQFGRIYLFQKGETEKVPLLNELGPEPLAGDFGIDQFSALFFGRSAQIKSLLLDQRFLAGLGNIYADEALFLSGIRPDRPADTLSKRERASLFRAIRRVLREGICFRGTSRRDYVDAEGRTGSYQDYLRVYGRRGKPCPRCSLPLDCIRVAGRNSHFCRGCQE